MRPKLKPAGAYGLLLILLFAIAAIAVQQTIGYIGDHLGGKAYIVTVILLCCVTYGFMLIAGAFGLYAIQFATQAEVRRRVGRIVDAMDYLQDGVLAVDRYGIVSGSNPTARQFFSPPIEPGASLKTDFPILNEDEQNQLLSKTSPSEIQKEVEGVGGARMLRFRSQFSEDLTLLLISDITASEVRRQRKRDSARSQLVGQLARGLAYDMNNLLCTISGHAALLSRLPESSDERQVSLMAINRSIDKGTHLAGHLMELASSASAPTAAVSSSHEYIKTAIESLKDSLPSGWTILPELLPLPPLTVADSKIEQIILNLGLLAADRSPTLGKLVILTGPPSSKPPVLDVGGAYAAILVVATCDLSLPWEAQVATDESGVILSVIRTLIEDAGGRMDVIKGRDGLLGFRICLPYKHPLHAAPPDENYIESLQPYVAGWHAVLVSKRGLAAQVHRHLESLKVTVTPKDTVEALIGCLGDGSRTDAILIDHHAVARGWSGLLRALRKLAPDVGILILSETIPDEARTSDQHDFVIIGHNASPQEVLLALIEAKSLAAGPQPVRSSPR